MPGMADFYLDCKRMSCPGPLVSISQQMNRMLAGQTLEVEATDPAFRADLTAWLAMLGERLLHIEGGEALVVAVLAKT